MYWPALKARIVSGSLFAVLINELMVLFASIKFFVLVLMKSEPKLLPKNTNIKNKAAIPDSIGFNKNNTNINNKANGTSIIVVILFGLYAVSMLLIPLTTSCLLLGLIRSRAANRDFVKTEKLSRLAVVSRSWLKPFAKCIRDSRKMNSNVIAIKAPVTKVTRVASTPNVTYRRKICITNSGLANASMFTKQDAAITSQPKIGLANSRTRNSFNKYLPASVY